MDWLKTALDELKTANSNLVTLAVTAITLLFALGIARYTLIPYFSASREKRILDTRSWTRIVKALQPDWAHRYFGAIAASTGWFDRIYGPRLLGWRAFDRSLQFAFAYAISTLLIGWVLFDAGNLGGVAFFPAGLPVWQRAGAVMAMIAAGALLFSVLRFETPIKAWIAVRLLHRPAPLRRLRAVFFAEMDYLLLFPFAGFIAFASAFASAFIFAGAFAGDFAFAVVIAAVIAGTTVVTSIITVAGAISIASTIAMGFAYAFAFANARTDTFPYVTIDFEGINKDALIVLAVFLWFFVILPVLNAVADYLSIAATRQFLRRIHTRKSAVWGVLGGLAFDIVIAMACLALLLVLITQTLDLWAAYSPIPLTFDWHIYRDTLCAGNWQQGTMLWLMLATTLAPTALHLAVGVGAMVSHRAQVDERIATIMTPAYEKLKAGRAVEKGDGALARKLLTADDIQALEDLLARKEGLARFVSVLLFVVFMAALIWMVVALSQHFAMPSLCPTP